MRLEEIHRDQFLKEQKKKTERYHEKGSSSQTDGARGLRNVLAPYVVENLKIREAQLASRPSKVGIAAKEWNRLSSWISHEVVAHIGITVVLDNLGRGNSLGAPVTSVQQQIGEKMEDQAFIAYMQTCDPKYHELLTKWYLNSPVRSYRHKVGGMKRAHNRYEGMEWNWLTTKEQVALGSVVLRMILMVQVDPETGEGLFEIRKPDPLDPQRPRQPKTHNFPKYLGKTVTGLKYQDAIQQACDEAKHRAMPMICPPKDWTLDENGDVVRGGYLLPVPRVAAQLIHNSKGSHPGQICLDSLNRLQRTPYCVNEFILDTQQEMAKKSWDIDGWITYEKASYEDAHKPLYSSEYLDSLDPEGEEYREAMKALRNFHANQMIDERQSATPRRIMAIAQEYRHRAAIYFVWFLDNRGRVYPLSELTPQGTG